MRHTEKDRRRSSSFHFFFTFCLTLCLLTAVSVFVVAFIYKPEIGENMLSDAKSCISGIVSSSGGTKPTVSGTDRKNGFYTVLVCGTDYDGTRTDTIVLAAIDTDNDTVNLMSIPRDTRAYMASGNVHKINAAHNNGDERMLEEITNTIGFTPDRYVVLDYGDFEKIINTIGGVELDVAQDMYYICDDMTIDLKAGTQTLDGEQALMYMRFRHDYPDADLGRIRAQQELFKAVAKKMMSLKTLFKAKDLADIFYDDIETDLTLSEAVWFGIQCLGIDADSLTVDMLPGHISGADYVVDDDEALELINEKYSPYNEPITELNTAE